MKATIEIERMWSEYAKRKDDITLRNALVKRYFPLVKLIATRMMAKLPRYVEMHDLAMGGVLGLIQAVEKFDHQRGIKFETYCSVRIRGAILDEIRSTDWVPRMVRHAESEVKKTFARLQTELGREPTHRDLTIAFGVSSEECERILQKARPTLIQSLPEDVFTDDNSEMTWNPELADPDSRDPGLEIQNQDLWALITKCLNEKERTVLFLYYFEGLNMQEVAAMIGLTESRVCQIHSRIMENLQYKLRFHHEALLS